MVYYEEDRRHVHFNFNVLNIQDCNWMFLSRIITLIKKSNNDEHCLKAMFNLEVVEVG